jgi:hypothetical protein
MTHYQISSTIFNTNTGKKINSDDLTTLQASINTLDTSVTTLIAQQSNYLKLDMSNDGSISANMESAHNFKAVDIESTGNVIIAGDLTVNGTNVILQGETIQIEDKNIELSKNSVTDAASNGAGLTIKAASDKTLLYLSATDSFDFNKSVGVNGVDLALSTHTHALTDSTGEDVISTGTHDLDTYQTSGIFIFERDPSNITNLPTDWGVGWQMTLFVYSYSANWSQQVLFNGYDDRTYTRRRTVSTWSTWRRLADESHTHDDRYYTESEADTQLAAKSDTGHTHDDRYYTESEADTLLAAKAASSHTHDDRYYTESEADTQLAAKSDTGHTHSGYLATTGGTMSGEIDMASNNINLYNSEHTIGASSGSSWYIATGSDYKIHKFRNGATPADSFTISYFDVACYRELSLQSNKITNLASGTVSADGANYGQLTTGLAGKSDTAHTHDDRYYTESEADTQLAGKSDTSHTHSTYLALAGGTMTGIINCGSNRLTNLGAGISASDSVTKSYVDDLGDVRVGQFHVTTGNIDLDDFDLNGEWVFDRDDTYISNDPTGTDSWQLHLKVRSSITWGNYVLQELASIYDKKFFTRFRDGYGNWQSWTEFMMSNGDQAMDDDFNLDDNMLVKVGDVCSDLNGSQAMSHWYGGTSGTSYEIPDYMPFNGSAVKAVYFYGTSSGTITLLSGGVKEIVACGGHAVWSNGNQHCFPWPNDAQYSALYCTPSTGYLYAYFTSGYASYKIWVHYTPV